MKLSDLETCPEFQKMVRGDYYFAGNPVLQQARLDAKKLCRKYNDTEGDPEDLGLQRLSQKRVDILKELLNSFDPKNIEIEPPCRVDFGCNISVGTGFYANYNLIVLDVGKVVMGDRVLLGPNVQIYAASHPLDPQERASGAEFGRDVRIGNDVWIGGNVVVLPGIVIGDGVTIAASSLVNRNVPSHCVMAGVPARIVKKLPAYTEPV